MQKTRVSAGSSTMTPRSTPTCRKHSTARGRATCDGISRAAVVPQRLIYDITASEPSGGSSKTSHTGNGKSPPWESEVAAPIAQKLRCDRATVRPL
jgi:hypothetical protein